MSNKPVSQICSNLVNSSQPEPTPYDMFNDGRSAAYQRGLKMATVKVDELQAERDELYAELIGQEHTLGTKIETLQAQLAQRHIIGKVYDVTRESVNQLAGELDELKAQHTFERLAKEAHVKQYRELEAEVGRLKADNARFGDQDEHLKGLAIDSYNTGFEIIKLKADLAAMTSDRADTLRSLMHAHECYTKALDREAELVEVLEFIESSMRDYNGAEEIAREALEANKKAKEKS